MSDKDVLAELGRELGLLTRWAKAVSAGRKAERRLSELSRRREAMELAVGAGSGLGDFEGDCESLRVALSDFRSTMRQRATY